MEIKACVAGIQLYSVKRIYSVFCFTNLGRKHLKYTKNEH